MKRLSTIVLASLPLLLVGLAPSQAQDPIGGLRPARSPQLLGVYTGHSIDGNLQEALDEALSEAYQGVSDSTGISDVMFDWDLTRIRGTRGGFMGMQDIWVEVTVR